jgi:hypothetical protein
MPVPRVFNKNMGQPGCVSPEDRLGGDYMYGKLGTRGLQRHEASSSLIGPRSGCSYFNVVKRQTDLNYTW